MRIYDPRLGRFLSVDPITKQYPELTPYQFASNRPIDGVDQDGLEWAPPLMYDPKQKKMVVDVRAAYENHSHPYNAIAVLAPVDVLITKGWLTRTFVIALGASAFPHNKSSTPEGQAAQNRSSRESLAEAFTFWGLGKLLEVPLRVPLMGNEVPGPVRGPAEQNTRFNSGSVRATEASSESNTSNPSSTFLGGAKGKLFSKQNILEAHHAPSMKSYKLAGFVIKYNEGSALQMLYDDHRAFISSDRSLEAIEFINKEANYLRSGDYMGAFELNAKRIVKEYGEKYNEAISQARDEFKTKIIPQLREQAAAKANP